MVAIWLGLPRRSHGGAETFGSQMLIEDLKPTAGVGLVELVDFAVLGGFAFGRDLFFFFLRICRQAESEKKVNQRFKVVVTCFFLERR